MGNRGTAEYHRDFYPRSPRGERLFVRLIRAGCSLHFYPRSPRGERQQAWATYRQALRFLSTLPAWGATPSDPGSGLIDIISIHAPRVGSDLCATIPRVRLLTFLSTLPAWGATAATPTSATAATHFYPRSPRGERRSTREQFAEWFNISIHAPRVGSDHGTI